MRNRYFTAMLFYSAAAGALPSLGHAQPSAAVAESASAGWLSGARSSTAASPQRQAAAEGLAILAGQWAAAPPPPRTARIFDIDDYRTLRNATIGDGFETYLVDPEALLSGKRIDESLYRSGEWRFVVMVGGKGIGLITVARMHDRWKMVEAGASELAGEVVAVAARYERQSPPPRLRFIRSPQAIADFIEICAPNTSSPISEPVYVPLASARALLAERQSRAATPDSVLLQSELAPLLRPRVARGMSTPKFAH